MALSFQAIFFFSSSLFLLVSISHSQEPIVLPVAKDSSSLQHVTTIQLGPPLRPIRLVVDLSGPFLWLHCPSSGRPSPVPCRSIQCLTAEGKICGNVNCFTASTTVEQRKSDRCRLNPKNPITQIDGEGDLAEGTVAVRSQLGQILTVDEFLFSCAPPNLLRGLATGAQGVLGLGRTRIALPSQAIGLFGRKFSICLSSSSEGAILAGERKPLSVSSALVWNSLTYTPLIGNQGDLPESYIIGVKSIAVNGNKLPIRAVGATMISTVVPYTLMESSIYAAFTKAFIEKAKSMNMTRAEAMGPFEVCFRSESIGETAAGPAVPAVDLVLQSDMVTWRIHGGNSMVQVSEEVTCLGFVDGGALNSGNAMVLGGYQLEDNLLNFDLGSSMLGFSSSLLVRGSSCALEVLMGHERPGPLMAR